MVIEGRKSTKRKRMMSSKYQPTLKENKKRKTLWEG